MRRAGRALLVAPFLVALGGCRGTRITAPDVDATTTEPGPAVYRASGAFTKVAYGVSGHVTYWIDADGNAALALDDAFSEPAVPAPTLFLSNTADLQDAVRVGRVTGDGAAHWTFRMPRGAVWRYVVLWSDGLGVQVARAELAPES